LSASPKLPDGDDVNPVGQGLAPAEIKRNGFIHSEKCINRHLPAFGNPENNTKNRKKIMSFFLI